MMRWIAKNGWWMFLLLGCFSLLICLGVLAFTDRSATPHAALGIACLAMSRIMRLEWLLAETVRGIQEAVREIRTGIR